MSVKFSVLNKKRKLNTAAAAFEEGEADSSPPDPRSQEQKLAASDLLKAGAVFKADM